MIFVTAALALGRSVAFRWGMKTVQTVQQKFLCVLEIFAWVYSLLQIRDECPKSGMKC
jgi:hypothetical protein